MESSDDEDISQGDRMAVERSFNAYTPMRKWRKVSYGFDKLLFASLRFALEHNLFGVLVDNEHSKQMKAEVDKAISYCRKLCDKHVEHQAAVRAAYSPIIKEIDKRQQDERLESMRIVRALLEYMAILAEDVETFSETKLPV